MSYIGSTPVTQSFIAGTDYFNGTGSATAFTLSRSVVSANDIQATVNNVVQQPNDAYTVSGTTITFTSAPSAGTNNIYVRYLSTTTQSITPSQGTVSNTSFGNVTAIPFVAGPSLGAGNASIMKNRIINGAMVISQRYGTTATANTISGYTLDRFQVIQSTTGKLIVQQNAGSVTPPVGFSNYLGITSQSAYSIGSGDYYFIVQYIEGFNTADLGWGTANAKTITISFQVYSSLTGTFGGSLRNATNNRSYPFTYTVSSANTWTTVSVTIAGDTTGTWVGATNGIGLQVIFGLGVGSTFSGTAGAWAGANYISATGATSVVGTSGATFYITGVQLEVGVTATTFDYRSIGTELALCQRYCVKYGGSSTYEHLGQGNAYATTGGQFEVPLATTMRTTPSATVSGNWVFSDGVTNTAITAFALASSGNECSPNILSGTVTVASGLTQYRPYFVFANNSLASSYIISAEL